MSFLWTARRFEDDKPVEARYFESQQERDQFVADHAGWKKRGKICKDNLGKHKDQNQYSQEDV